LPKGAFLTWAILNPVETDFTGTLARLKVITGTGGGSLTYEFDAIGGQFPMPAAGVQAYIEAGSKDVTVSASVCAGSPPWFTRLTSIMAGGDKVLPPPWANSWCITPGSALLTYPLVVAGQQVCVTGPLEAAIDSRVIWSSL